MAVHWSIRLHKQPKLRYAFCEKVTATEISPHHIRQLTDKGMFKSGAADTPALCGAKVAWDTNELQLADLPRILEHQHSNWHVCSGCAEAASALPV